MIVEILNDASLADKSCSIVRFGIATWQIASYDPDLDDNARTRDASRKKRKLGVGRGPEGTGAMGDIADD
jgi:hypothetical protein